MMLVICSSVNIMKNAVYRLYEFIGGSLWFVGREQLREVSVWHSDDAS
jgi:hypothetical protein